MSKKVLKFDEAIKALESAGHIILLCPDGDELVCTDHFFEEGNDSDLPEDNTSEEGLVTRFRLTADGIDDIIMERGMTFDISDDGHGFYVPGYRLGVFPQKSFDFKA